MKYMKIYLIGFLAIYWIVMLLAPANADILPIKKPKINYSNIYKHIKMNEGYSNKVYLDTRGYKTVGYGHKLPSNTDLKVGDIIRDVHIQLWFRTDVNSALSCARNYLEFDYNETELLVITDMAFNLGCRGLNSFWRLKKHINNKNYNMAVKAIRGSTYYNQVKNRAERNIKLLRNQ